MRKRVYFKYNDVAKVVENVDEEGKRYVGVLLLNGDFHIAENLPSEKWFKEEGTLVSFRSVKTQHDIVDVLPWTPKNEGEHSACGFLCLNLDKEMIGIYKNTDYAVSSGKYIELWVLINISRDLFYLYNFVEAEEIRVYNKDCIFFIDSSGIWHAIQNYHKFSELVKPIQNSIIVEEKAVCSNNRKGTTQLIFPRNVSNIVPLDGAIMIVFREGQDHRTLEHKYSADIYSYDPVNRESKRYPLNISWKDEVTSFLGNIVMRNEDFNDVSIYNIKGEKKAHLEIDENQMCCNEYEMFYNCCGTLYRFNGFEKPIESNSSPMEKLIWVSLVNRDTFRNFPDYDLNQNHNDDEENTFQYSKYTGMYVKFHLDPTEKLSCWNSPYKEEGEWRTDSNDFTIDGVKEILLLDNNYLGITNIILKKDGSIGILIDRIFTYEWTYGYVQERDLESLEVSFRFGGKYFIPISLKNKIHSEKTPNGVKSLVRIKDGMISIVDNDDVVWTKPYDAEDYEALLRFAGTFNISELVRKAEDYNCFDWVPTQWKGPITENVQFEEKEEELEQFR